MENQRSKIECIENDLPLKNLTQYHVSVITMLVQCLSALTLEDNNWIAEEEFYSKLNTHPFSYQDIENNKCFKFTLNNLKHLMPMISYMGIFNKKEENNLTYFRINKSVDKFTLSLNHSLHTQ
jgi:hypothetical protein